MDANNVPTWVKAAKRGWLLRHLWLRAVCCAATMSCIVSILLTAPAMGATENMFPQRPVKIIVQTAAGSSIDITARIIAEKLSHKWGQQVYVINQPGVGGSIAVRALAAAIPDGETLLFAASSIFVALPVLHPAVADTVNKLTPVTFIGEQPMALVVSANNPAKDLAELIAIMRKTPGGLNCAVLTRGGLAHLSGEILKDAVGVEMTFIHYAGTAQAMSDVIADRVPMVIDGMSAFIGPAASGQVRILGVGSAQRVSKLLPDVPAIAETLSGFEAIGWLALTAPSGTPAPILAQIKRDADEILSDPAVSNRLQELGTITRKMSDVQLADFFRAQRAKWLPVAQKSVIAK